MSRRASVPMSRPDLALGPEWAILELLARSGGGVDAADGAGSDVDARLGELLRHPELSWGELLEQALRQKLLPMLAHHVTAEEHRGLPPKPIRRHLERTLDLNRHAIDLLRREAGRITAALDDAGVVAVATKGITFESTLYAGLGTRPLLDVDFMIRREDREAVVEVMRALGFESGLYDWRQNRVVPLSRRDQITHRFNPDHLPNFARPSGDPVIRHLYVDFANSLTWTSSPYEVPVEDGLAGRRRQPIPGVEGVELPCFAPDFQLVFTALHLFREAWFERWMEADQDVNLMKFGDLVRLWEREQEGLAGPELVDLLEGYGIVGPVVWVLEHLDRTLGTAMVAALGLGDRVTEEWLASAYKSGGQLRRWQGTMRQRLHCKDREALFEEGT